MVSALGICAAVTERADQEGFKEGQTNEIHLPTITGKLLEKAGLKLSA